MSEDKQKDKEQNAQTTEYEWDGIKELNNPMPRWWVYIFYATIIFSIIYMILMPALPGIHSYTKGVLHHSDRAEVMKEIESLNASRSTMMSRLTDASLSDIRADDNLFEYAMAAGGSAFGDNCSTCHGTGAQGFIGYPNLNDDIWIWGGSFDDIRKTITVGIRSTDGESRYSEMQAFGRDGFLKEPEISDITQYVLQLSGQEADASAALRGANLYQTSCASCHGEYGHGDRSVGAPDLTDSDWLYGGSAQDIRQSIYNGRQGVMPHWSDRLSPEMITALSVYVYSLGGGEDTPVSQ